MTNLNKWSTTAANNATSDGSLWPEAMAAAAVNNSARDNMAANAKYRDDLGGGLTTGGTTEAYTVTTNSTNTDTETLRAGFRITLKINAANTITAPTLAIDGGTAKAIQKRGAAALAVGDLEANAYYDLVYNGSVWEVVSALGPGITSLADDTSPQLGGDLDANGNQIKWAKGADVASATALPVLTDGNYFDVTGTTTITSIDTCGGDGTIAPVIKLHFDGALILTHHTTNIVLPGGANITTAAGDEAEFVEYGSGTWRCTKYTKATGKPVIAGSIGKQTFWIPAKDMEPRVTTAPATLNVVEIGTSLLALRTMDFATDADDHAGFAIQMPKSWDLGQVIFQFVWSATGAQTAGLDGVAWFCAGRAYASDDLLTNGPNAGVGVVQDHSGTADDIMITSETAEYTITGIPAAEEWVYFDVYRDVSDAGDDLDINARLHGVKIHYTVNAATDD